MTKQKQDRSRRRLTGASGAEALALSFEALVTLLGLIPGSIRDREDSGHRNQGHAVA